MGGVKNGMKGKLRLGLLATLALLAVYVPKAVGKDTPEAADILRAALNHWRDSSSRMVFEMTVHRPDWERRLRLRMWTQGQKRSLLRVEAPPRDAGNATLLRDGRMWTYSPRINRVIRVPSSMMQQSWMGSDFSNNDVARGDEIIEQYRHRIVATGNEAGHVIYTIESIPLAAAPVVWGHELIRVRDDHVMLEHAFFDQEGVLVKRMLTEKIGRMGGKTVALVETMYKAEKADEWTRIELLQATYGIALPDTLFSLSNLRNPRSEP